jgi:hypothetical protein
VSYPDAEKWVAFAAKVQADLIAFDAADPGAPITDHEVKRAALHTRHDMVLLTTHLAFLNAQVRTPVLKGATHRPAPPG